MNFNILYNYYFLQKTVYPVVNKTGIHSFMRNRLQSRGIIVMLHRIQHDKSTDIHFQFNSQWFISQSAFRELITFFIKDYTFISIDEIIPYLESENKKQFVVFTFDDGYKDTCEFAYPVLKEFNVPFTVYLCPGLLNHESILFEYLFEDFLLTLTSFRWKDKIFKLNSFTLTEKENLFKQLIVSFEPFSGPAAIERIKFLFNSNNYDYKSFMNSILLNWDEVLALNGDKLVTLGSHSYNHFCLSSLTDEESEFEITNSKILIESKIGHQVSHFAYPYGQPEHVTRREVEFARKAGYLTAVTSVEGNIYNPSEHTPYIFPRISINNKTNLKDLQTTIDGVRSYVINNFSKTIRI